MKIGDTDIKMKEDVQDGIHLQTIMHRTKNSSPIWIEDHGTHSSSLLGIMQKQVDFITTLSILSQVQYPTVEHSLQLMAISFPRKLNASQSSQS
jgi:hypothetical protein